MRENNTSASVTDLATAEWRSAENEINTLYRRQPHAFASQQVLRYIPSLFLLHCVT